MIFKKRTESPSYTNKYYIKAGRGGYNRAMEINKINHSCLPNCCGLSYMVDGWNHKIKKILKNMINCL